MIVQWRDSSRYDGDADRWQSYADDLEGIVDFFTFESESEISGGISDKQQTKTIPSKDYPDMYEQKEVPITKNLIKKEIKKLLQ